MAEKLMVSNAMEATIWIEVECLDSDPQIADNFEISLYLTDLADTSLESGRNMGEVSVFFTYSYTDICDQILEDIQMKYA